MSQKKRVLEQWEQDECAALKEAISEWNSIRPKNERITQEQAGEALGMNQGSFSNYLNGRTALNFEFALKIKNLFGIPVERYSQRLADEIREKYEILERQENARAHRAHNAVLNSMPANDRSTQITFLELNRFFENCESDGYAKRRAVVRNTRNHVAHGILDEDRLSRIYKLIYSIAAAEIDGHLSDQEIAMMGYLTMAIDSRYEEKEIADKQNTDQKNLIIPS